jgi:hypothetical protein
VAKDLILTYATDVEYSSLRRLIVSARRVCPPELVDIVVIINPLGDQFAELAERYNVQLFPCNSLWKEIRPHLPLRIFCRLLLAATKVMDRYPRLFGSPQACGHVHRTLAAPWQHAIPQRHFIFHNILQLRSNYRMVFLTDARDVVVQANPFSLLDEDKLHVFLQEKEVFGEDNIDTIWARKVLGPVSASRLSGKAVSCCGTTIGGRGMVLTYLQMMTSSILQHEFNVVDQVIHNAIIYLGYPQEQLVSHRNREGTVITLSGVSASDVELTATELRVDRRVVPVVHMYDRIPEINEFFCALYPDDLLFTAPPAYNG